MKSAGLLFAAVLVSMSTLTLAQQHEMKAGAQAAPTEAQQSFAELKSLAGKWQGTVKADPPQKDWDGGTVNVTLRVTSRGNALVHEIYDPAKDDPTKYDHPLTMFYLDQGQLLLTHYCDAGNRPRMTARTSPDGKTVDFDFLDVAGPTNYGHMQHGKFIAQDADHHVEEWTYLMPGDKPVKATLTLHRVN